MSLGTSIFFSSVLLASVALYIATKDRWSWKRIILWPLAGLILIACALWTYNTITQRAKVQTAFWNIPLGATKSDVKFLKGAPKVLPNDKDQDTWEYLTEDTALKQWEYVYRVGFKNDKVWLIEYFASRNRTYGPGIQGIDLGDTLEKITEKFGSPSRVSLRRMSCRVLFHLPSIKLPLN
jgi:hypothetical protein